MRQTLAAARRWTCRATTRCATTCCTRWKTTRRSSPCTRPTRSRRLGGIDDALHLLVYDILHTAYAEQFYPRLHPRLDEQERAKAVKEKADRAELCIRIGECEQELQELLANPAALPDLTGCKINHKVFGAGTVRPAEGQFMVIDFNGTLKKFSYTASMNSGYLSAEDPNVEARLQAYQDYNKDKERLEKELKNLKAELVKL